MSRARDMANLGSQAGSGFDASDLTTGTLGNTVQDNITRLGIVTTGTMKNTIHADATFPAGNVINLEIKQYADTSSETLTTTDSAIPGMEFTYDVKEQTSKLYVAAYPLIATEHHNTIYTHKFSLRSSVDSYGSTLGNGNVPQIVHYGNPNLSQWLQYPTLISCFHDHNQTAGTTITYKIYGHTKNDTAGIYIWDTWGHNAGPTTTQHAVIYEVAQ